MDLASVKPFPDLPTDVARSILEIAAYEDPCTAENLTRVSKIVRQWIDPIFHHTIVIETSLGLKKFHDSIISRHDSLFFARHVKNLLIGDYDEGLLEPPPNSAYPFPKEKESLDVVLSACCGLERFALWLPEHNFEALSHYFGEHGCSRPTHLSVLDITQLSVPSRNCIRIWPPSLTHLHLDEARGDDTALIPWQAILLGCSNLTHILLSGGAITTHFSHGGLAAIIKEPLAARPSTLTAFIILIHEDLLPSSEDMQGVMRLRPKVEPLLEASDCVVLLTYADISYAPIPGIHHFPQEHTLEADWGDGPGMDTWEFADWCLAEQERKRRGKSDVYTTKGVVKSE